MDGLVAMIDRAVEQLLGRASGPLHGRLVIQPLVASFLAIRAGLRDARAGRPPFLWTILTNPMKRKALARSAWKDIGTMFLVAMTIDVVYQVFVFRAVYVVQTLIVAIVVAVTPYTLLRGLAARIASLVRKTPPPADVQAGGATKL